MFRRHLSKVLRYAVILLLYITLYFVISYEIAPEVTVSFVSEDFRLGDKFVLIYLVAPKSSPFSDADGSEVFSSRRCGKCFITNNKGFLPLTEYDAVVTLADSRLDAQASHQEQYAIETTKKCLYNKLKGCVREPRITSTSTKKTYDLCSMCEHLHGLRKPEV